MSLEVVQWGLRTLPREAMNSRLPARSPKRWIRSTRDQGKTSDALWIEAAFNSASSFHPTPGNALWVPSNTQVLEVVRLLLKQLV
jgi:hypothetical protein